MTSNHKLLPDSR